MSSLETLDVGLIGHILIALFIYEAIGFSLSAFGKFLIRIGEGKQ